jgi:hypothetical protein
MLPHSAHPECISLIDRQTHVGRADRLYANVFRKPDPPASRTLSTSVDELALLTYCCSINDAIKGSR